ncbi:Serine/threonine-protein kinase PknB [Roseimaritima multifibrata]|uniref:Serine/threonine-protein kinase PknB n=1 Tax=Roseimaritima multifibrata TaxID=1930274 RepID=A0A517MGS0_9BACT|nr:serine/threonine protein kinase [Roseimaritima multifibrata]QDS94075.1 Serine/threonine-protein kinase PknB [Roseimaritima multifibrata]
MTPEQYAKARALFQAAEELPLGERAAFVEQQTTDVVLRREVLSLLQFHDAEAARIEGTTVNAAPAVEDQGQAEVNAGAAKTSLPEFPSVIRAAHGSQSVSPRRSRRLFLLPLLFALLVGLPVLMLVLAIQQQIQTGIEEARYSQLQTIGDTSHLTVQYWTRRKSEEIKHWVDDIVITDQVRLLLAATQQPDELERRNELASARDKIRAQFQSLVGPQPEYVLWNRSGIVLASSNEERDVIGTSIAPEFSPALSRGFAGETVFYQSKWSDARASSEGFVPHSPWLAIAIAVRGSNGAPEAVFLFRNMGLDEDLNEIFQKLQFDARGEVYAIDDRGRIRSQLRQSPKVIAARLIPAAPDSAQLLEIRAGDPGRILTPKHPLDQPLRTLPLTIGASRAAVKLNGQTIEPYRNYLGVQVIGAWRWVPELQLGILAEMPSADAFSSLHILQYLLGGLVIVSTFGAAVTGFVLERKICNLRESDEDQLGRYELLEELGSGGMGIVFRAQHQLMKSPAALKVIRPDRFDRENTLRFDREVQLAACLRSPHAVSIFDYGWTADGRAYCAMELLEGITVHQAVVRGGAMAPGRVVHVLVQLCDALSEAHRLGLVHRDVKPRNVMLAPRGPEQDWAVLFDFGLAKPTENDSNLFMTQERVWAGTPMFMAPERFRNPGRTDPRSDIYSLGAVGYFMLSGRQPFSEIDPSGMFELILKAAPTPLDQLLADDSLKPLADIIRRCMEKDKGNRPQDADELRKQLRKIQNNYPWDQESASLWWETYGQEN